MLIAFDSITFDYVTMRGYITYNIHLVVWALDQVQKSVDPSYGQSFDIDLLLETPFRKYLISGFKLCISYIVARVSSEIDRFDCCVAVCEYCGWQEISTNS